PLRGAVVGVVVFRDVGLPPSSALREWCASREKGYCGDRVRTVGRGGEAVMNRAEEPRASAYDATPFLPDGGDLAAHRRAAAACHGCPLYENATQTVFGRGDAS